MTTEPTHVTPPGTEGTPHTGRSEALGAAARALVHHAADDGLNRCACGQWEMWDADWEDRQASHAAHQADRVFGAMFQHEVRDEGEPSGTPRGAHGHARHCARFYVKADGVHPCTCRAERPGSNDGPVKRS